MDPILEYNGVQIFPFDMDTLDSEGLLNNAILDFYLKYLYDAKLSNEQRKKVEICTSFFHLKMLQEDNENLELPQIHILNKDFVLIPVNAKQHWFLIILCYPRNLVDNNNDPKERPRIIVLDSSIDFLKRQRKDLMKKLLSFVQEQVMIESGKSVDVDVLSIDIVPILQQDNEFDCGLFLLEFAEKFLLDNLENFQETPSSSAIENVTIDCDEKRRHIKELIETLSASQYI
ncbi:probable ubiquitin-like-specific protease 2A [Contarinia nasturtii]|uniref:probable ubiquitin-like-specific protease 2A n=1 Tax=Contarinia nasturtii TaxID=265458 RepID=UPI0012D4073A|nr:probable ubiquitin-like-specific protease 2A [Contarinia nasturtii]